MTQGIYVITCKTTGKTYIGGSGNVEQRLNTHARELRQHKHGNRLLQEAWDNYGADDFTFALAEEVMAYDDLPTREQCHMDKRGDSGYNIITKPRAKKSGAPISAEYISLVDASVLLGVSRDQMMQCVKDTNMTTYINALNRRWVLLSRAEVMALKENPVRQAHIR